MKAAKSLVVATVWAASLLGVGLWAQSGRGAAPPIPVQPIPPIYSPGDPIGPIITGDNIGLQRLAGAPDRNGQIPVRWMIRIDGEWHEAAPGGPKMVR